MAEIGRVSDALPASSVPKASVVIPTYGRPEPLRRTLAALLTQRIAGEWEVVVCDDGSPDREAAHIAAVVDAAGRDGAATVRLIRQENAGPAAARNAGARAARSSLLVFLDDDCAPAPGMLEVHLRTHEGDADGLVVMGHVAWDPAQRVTPFMELVVRGAQFNYGAIADPDRVPFTCFYTANCSMRRDSLERAGWFDATLPPYMEDTEFAYRLVNSGGQIVYRPAAQVFHEHAVELRSYLDRQRKAGRAAVEVVRRHPELFDVVGVSDVADIGLREQFYAALLRYAFVQGVEEALAGQEQSGLLTGEELRTQFEGWTAHWALRQASTLRALRREAEGLRAELGRRDAQLAWVVQEKDARIASLEGQLARVNALPPVRLLHWVRRARRPRSG